HFQIDTSAGRIQLLPVAEVPKVQVFVQRGLLMYRATLIAMTHNAQRRADIELVAVIARIEEGCVGGRSSGFYGMLLVHIAAEWNSTFIHVRNGISVHINKIA